MDQQIRQISERLEKFRKKLLDTSRRNRLVNFRSHSSSSNKPIEKVVVVEEENPANVYRLLVTDSKSMSFTGIRDRRSNEESETTSPVVSRSLEIAVDQNDDNLSTKLTETRLERHLTKIRRDQILMIEEQGINALFLSLGHLRWIEADQSKEVRLAPLILIPVLLERTERGGFKLKWDGTEIGWNLSLGALLKEDFAIDLPSIESEGFSVENYFDRVALAVSSQTNWTIDRNAICLAFFSFAKYLIYKDLTPSNWPNDRNILLHPVLGALLGSGFEEPDESLSEEDHLDQHRPVGKTNEVFDADGSQTLAILQALKGHSMVIEGPPGTGKSQTIANLIAEFVGEGKRVLFVSEKSAALNVVYDRLKNASLAGACLELHGTKANKRTFYQTLRETMEQAQPRRLDFEAVTSKLASQRDELNQYDRDLHTVLDARGVTPREVIGKLIQLGIEPDLNGRIDPRPMITWNQTEFAKARATVAELQTQVIRIGLPVNHPFSETTRTYISPDDKADLARMIGQTLSAFKSFEDATKNTANRLHLAEPDLMADVEGLESAIDFIISSPDSSGVNFDSEIWSGDTSRLLSVISGRFESEDLRSRYASEFTSEGWQLDVSQATTKLILPGVTHIDASDEETWSSLDDAEATANEVIKLRNSVCQMLCIDFPSALWAIQAVAKQGIKLAAAPDCVGVEVESGKWKDESESIRNAVSQYRKVVTLKQQYASEVRAEAWKISVNQLVQVLERDGSKILRRLFGNEYKASRRKAVSLLMVPPTSRAALIETLKSIAAVQQLEEANAPFLMTIRQLFGSQWKDETSNFEHLEQCAKFLGSLHTEISTGKLPTETLRLVSQPTTLSLVGEESRMLLNSIERCVGSVHRLNKCYDRVSGGASSNLPGDPVERLFKYVVGDLFEARRLSNQFFTASFQNSKWSKLTQRLDICKRVQTLDSEVKNYSETAKECLGSHWLDVAATNRELVTLVQWISSFTQKVSSGVLPPGLKQFFTERAPKDGLSIALTELRAVREGYSDCLEQVASKAELKGGANQFLSRPLYVQERIIESWAENVDDLEDYFRYNVLSNACKQLGLVRISELAHSWNEAPDRLTRELERSWCNFVMEEAMASRPILRNFDRKSHEEVLASFRLLDKTLIDINRARVSSTHWRSVPRTSAVGEIGFIRMQMNRQRGHRPIRVAMREAPSAVQSIKPVFLMSPMSVAMYLPPEGPLFDVVIFDEASQIKPEDALGSVIRAKQIIVVGDTKQMPPTSIFERMTSTEEPDDDESDDIEGQDIAEQESILAFASARIAGESPYRRDLRWHYRSRHEDLIKTSNRLFYRDRLVIFPHPKRSDSEMGLVFRHCPQTIYGRGNSRKNELEAREIAKAALHHVRSSPSLTLGIVAFSKAQQESIEDQIDLLRKHDPAFGAFDARHGLEKLFIKNLESVQGDERDVIFISIGYGRDESGFLGMSFGTLNNKGGERRLNVLITRARVRTVVFSNFRAADMRIGETKSKGVEALHTFLAFAESGHLDVVPTMLKLEPSYFEELVFEKLRNRGYDVEKQVGSEGFYIDLAVRHPSEPGRFAIGIECDGAMYHSARSARDRDRLRQQVLEDRGWIMHRIWSTDWWRHPERELNRCCQAIELAVAGNSLGVQVPEVYEPEEPQMEIPFEFFDEATFADDVPVPSDDSEFHAVPYITAHLSWPIRAEILDLSEERLYKLVQSVVDVEAPIHLDEIISRIREAAGKGRAGRLIRDHILRSILVATNHGVITVKGAFAYRPDQSIFSVRSRSDFAQQVKRIDLVAPEEILAAVVHVLREAVAVEIDKLAKPTARLLGFDRITREMESQIRLVIEEGIQSGRLSSSNEKVVLGVVRQ